VAGRLPEKLVPRIEAGRDVPDGLGHRQEGRLVAHHLPELERRPHAQQAVVVVDEAHVAVVVALVERHEGVRRVDADGLADELRHGSPGLDEVVEDPARADLVAREDALLEGGVGSISLALTLGRRRDHRHRVPPSALE